MPPRIVLVLLSLASCYVAPTPVRAPRTVSAGQGGALWTWGTTWGNGVANISAGDGTVRTVEGGLSAHGGVPLGLTGALGIGRYCSVSATISASRLGGDIECGTASDSGFSAALVAGSYYQPFGGMQVVGGIVSGRRIGASTTAFAGPIIEYGTTFRGIELPRDLARGGPHSSAILEFKRTGLRLQAALGISIQVERFERNTKVGGYWNLFVAPFWNVGGGEFRFSRCRDCSISQATFRESWGVGLFLGAGPWGPN